MAEADLIKPKTAPLTPEKGRTGRLTGRLVIDAAHPEYKFTETFYNQLVVNLDEVFEDIFLSSIEELPKEDAQGAPQLAFDEGSLRTLFADIAAIYAEPVKNFMRRLEKGMAQRDEGEVAYLALGDISRAGSSLGLDSLCGKVDQLAKEIDQLRTLPSTQIPAAKKDALLLSYSDLIQILPQTFTIEGFKKPGITITPNAPQANTRMTVSMAALSSNLLVYHYPPRLHKNIDIIEQEEGGQAVFWFKDTRSNRYFKAKKRERDIILLFDGTRTLSELCDTIKKQMKVGVKMHQLVQIIAKLDTIGLIDGVEDPKLKKQVQVDKNAPTIIHLYNPDNLFTRLDKMLYWIFTPTFIFGSIAIMVLVMAEMFRRHAEVAAYDAKVWQSYGIIGYGVFLLLSVSLHEFGHGLTCKHYGGRVTDTGIAFVGFILPAGYCNVSDIYLFKNKLHRVYVLLAGLYSQFLIATISAVVWLLLIPGTIISDVAYLLFWGSTISTFLNLIPLLKLDGYYALTNLLDEQNLQKQAFAYCSRLTRWIAFGEVVASKELTTFQKRFYLIYTILYSLFVIVYPAFLAVTFYRYLTHNGGHIGIILGIIAAWQAFRFVTVPLSKFPGACLEIIRKKDAPRLMRARASLVLTIPVAILIFLLFGSWTERTWAECELKIEPSSLIPITAPRDGVVSKILVQDRQSVSRGQVISVLESNDLDLERADISAQISLLRQQQAGLASKMLEQRAIIDQHKSWVALYQREAAELLDEDKAISEAQTGSNAYPADMAILQAQVVKQESIAQHRERVVKGYEMLAAEKLTLPILTEQARSEQRAAQEQQQRAQRHLDQAIITHRRASERAVAIASMARSELAAAEEKLRNLQLEEQRLAQAIKMRETEKALVQKKQGQMSIVAPQDGQINGVALEQSLGQPLTSGQELCKIVAVERLRTAVAVSEWEVSRLKVGQVVRYHMRAFSDREFNGRVEGIDPQPVLGKDGSRIYTAYLSVDNAVDNGSINLQPGMTGVAMIEIGRRPVREFALRWLARLCDLPIWLW